MHGFSSIMKFIIFFVYVPFVYSAITWLRNGEEHHENVDLGELMPNEDETFQKTAIFHVAPDEWKKNQYVPVVEHQGNTIQKILTEIESKSKIKSNKRPLKVDFLSLVSVAGVSLFLFICSLVRKMLS